MENYKQPAMDESRLLEFDYVDRMGQPTYWTKKPIIVWQLTTSFLNGKYFFNRNTKNFCYIPC